MRKQAKDDQDPGDISKLMNELRKLTKQISKRSSSSSSEESCEVVTMDTENVGEPTLPASNNQQSQPSAQQSNMTVMNKQQAV